MAAARNRSLVYESVIEHIKAALLAGRLTPGDRLPTVADMALQLHVSPSSVREAYRVLESMGVLDVTQGRGTFVAATPFGEGGVLRHFQLAEQQTLAHLFETRMLLEPGIAAIAAQRATAAEIEAIIATAREQEELHRTGRDFLEPDIRFHELILGAAHNPVVARMLSTVNDLLLESRRRTLRIPGASDKAVHYHLLIGFAIRDRDAEAALSLMHQHVTDVEQDALQMRPVER